MWYGLKKDSVLLAVRKFNVQPSAKDFGVTVKQGVQYKVVVVRIREIGTSDIH